MSNESLIPEAARCLKCGYLLRGLPTPVCPECGRTFEPADPATYDIRPPGRRRKKWIVRAVLLVLFLIVAAPRGVLTGKLTFTCAVCGDRTTVYRFDGKPPRWSPFRYPGFSWTNEEKVSTGRGLTSCSVHSNLSVSAQFEMYNGGRASGSGIFMSIDQVTFNGLLTNIDTAPQVLKRLMHPSNNGIRVGP